MSGKEEVMNRTLVELAQDNSVHVQNMNIEYKFPALCAFIAHTCGHVVN